MPTIDELFAAMAEAVSANDQDRFDGLERDLLAHFEGSFSGMPREIYERYLEVDRGWPAAVPPRVLTNAERSRQRTRSSSEARESLGPRTSISVRLPEAHVEWLVEFGTTHGANRSDVLTACLSVIRANPAIVAAVRGELEEAHDPSNDS